MAKGPRASSRVNLVSSHRDECEDGMPGSTLTAAGDSDAMGSAPAASRQVNRKGASAISRTVPSTQAAKRLA